MTLFCLPCKLGDLCNIEHLGSLVQGSLNKKKSVVDRNHHNLMEVLVFCIH